MVLEMKKLKYLLIFGILLLSILNINSVSFASEDGVPSVLFLNADEYIALSGAAGVAETTFDTNKSKDCRYSFSEILNFDNGSSLAAQESGKYLVNFNNAKYNKMSHEDKKEFMEDILGAISKSQGIGAATKNKLYSFISRQDSAVTAALEYLKSDVGTDVYSAKKWFAPFEGPIGTFLGLMCIIIFALTGISMVMDIFYLVIPAFQGLVERVPERLPFLYGNEERQGRPWGISNEAYQSLLDSRRSSEYVNVLALYFKRRVVVIIILAITLTYLMSGKIYDLILYITDSLGVF